MTIRAYNIALNTIGCGVG